MNIKDAKTEIMRTVQIYNQKDQNGHYLLSSVRQRPVLLIGPPGIGKTAIMEQIAEECGIGLVAYTITHHTRQSAVGLPVISHKNYQGKEYSVTEYTMSEIIASVYESIEKNAFKEGILFIDEINCVSETLVPTMLQFLQNKKFGTHSVPEGWIIVAAGNPPEYNPSAREFDIVTLDRIKRIDVEPDLNIWKEYAYSHNIHPAILSYLSLKPQYFYHLKNHSGQLYFATARGWEDLSSILYGYENLQFPVTKDLVFQYIQDPEIAEDLAAYYGLYARYQQDYHIAGLLSGQLDPEVYRNCIQLSHNASSDERITVCGLILDGWTSYFSEYDADKQFNRQFSELTAQVSSALDRGETLEQFTNARKHALQIQQEKSLISPSEEKISGQLIQILNKCIYKTRQAHLCTPDSIKKILLDQQNKYLLIQQDQKSRTSHALELGFDFVENAFGNGPELLFLTADLSRNTAAVKFISDCGCDAYFRHCDRLQFQNRRQKLLDQIQKLR